MTITPAWVSLNLGSIAIRLGTPGYDSANFLFNSQYLCYEAPWTMFESYLLRESISVSAGDTILAVAECLLSCWSLAIDVLSIGRDF
jgi:hypothetical protein